jgi:hypothetical protein
MANEIEMIALSAAIVIIVIVIVVIISRLLGFL